MISDLAPALPILASFGYSEREVRRHSPKWIGETLQSVTERDTEFRKHELLFGMSGTYYAVSAANGSQEAYDGMQEMRRGMGVFNEDEQHMLNPDAETDWDELEGKVQRVDDDAPVNFDGGGVVT